MPKLTALIADRIEQLRNCGLALPKSANAKRLLSLRSEDDFIDEETREPGENLIGLVLFFLVSESLLRESTVPVGSRGFHLDYECIYGDGDYASLVKQFAFLAGVESAVSYIRDWVDVPRNEVFLKFNFKGKEYYLRPKVDRDWADQETLDTVMRLFTRRGYRFYRLLDTVIIFLKNSTAKRIYELAPKIELEPFEV